MEHPLLQSYGPFEGWHILLIMGLTAIGFFLYQVRKAISLVMLGSQDNRFDSWDARILEFIIGWLGQKKVLRDRIAGTMHVFLFWGFLMLSSDMLDLATANFFSDMILPDLLNGPWNGMVELGYAMAMIGCVAALIRRMVFTPQKLKGKSNFETFEGNLIADGTLFLGPSGSFDGEAHVSEAYLEGSFSGALEAKHQTTLTVSAVFKGILDTQQASVTKGAEIIGDVRICNRRNL